MTIDISKLEAYLLDSSARNVSYSLLDAERSVEYNKKNVYYSEAGQAEESPISFKQLTKLFPGLTRKQEAGARRRLAGRLENRRENLDYAKTGLAKAEAKLAVLQQFKPGDLLPREATALAEAKAFNRRLAAWDTLKAAQKAAEKAANNPFELGAVRAEFKKQFKEAGLCYDLRPAPSHLTWNTRCTLKCMARDSNSLMGPFGLVKPEVSCGRAAGTSQEWQLFRVRQSAQTASTT